MDKYVIGIDQSYARTGITILKNKEVVRMFAIDFKECENNTKKRKNLREHLSRILSTIPFGVLTVIVERIRLHSQGFVSENYIKSTGALIATIIDICYLHGVPVYSVETRAWKSSIVGTSKPKQNKYGINPNKYPTIQYINKCGLLKHIVKEYTGKGKKGIIEIQGKKYEVIDDIADSYCIAMYGFLPESEQKLKEEHF